MRAVDTGSRRERARALPSRSDRCRGGERGTPNPAVFGCTLVPPLTHVHVHWQILATLRGSGPSGVSAIVWKSELENASATWTTRLPLEPYTAERFVLNGSRTLFSR